MTFLPLSPKKYWLALGAVGLLSLTPSFAATLSYSNMTAATSPGFGIGFDLPAFDSNLGTLDNIAFNYSILASGTLDVFNDGSDPFAGYGGQIMSVNALIPLCHISKARKTLRFARGDLKGRVFPR